MHSIKKISEHIKYFPKDFFRTSFCFSFSLFSAVFFRNGDEESGGNSEWWWWRIFKSLHHIVRCS